MRKCRHMGRQLLLYGTDLHGVRRVSRHSTHLWDCSMHTLQRHGARAKTCGRQYNRGRHLVSSASASALASSSCASETASTPSAGSSCRASASRRQGPSGRASRATSSRTSRTSRTSSRPSRSAGWWTCPSPIGLLRFFGFFAAKNDTIQAKLVKRWRSIWKLL